MEQTLQSYLSRFAQGIAPKSAAAVLELTAEGGTVPFIARYRKEKTGNLDEVQIRQVIEANETFQEIVKRKAFLVKEIGEQKNLIPEIEKRILLSWDLNELEEIYKPFKKKKKTKATIAREAGLEPLALWIWDKGHGKVQDGDTMEVKAKNFISVDKKIVTYDDAIKGAQDILVDKIANEPALRELVVRNYFEQGQVTSKAAKGLKPNSKYEMYTKDYSELVKNLLEEKASHRYMAMKRGWEEEELSVDIAAEYTEAPDSFTMITGISLSLPKVFRIFFKKISVSRPAVPFPTAIASILICLVTSPIRVVAFASALSPKMCITV